ncbi:MAG: PAS domain S-box protein [Deltaproteobacteria bacterium]|nr:PAS domain S-box protein [Deltaproteobacteria bacterium]MCB2186340.1 PAS domain S-box protein [Deltaproteobacteria bacterium]
MPNSSENSLRRFEPSTPLPAGEGLLAETAPELVFRFNHHGVYTFFPAPASPGAGPGPTPLAVQGHSMFEFMPRGVVEERLDLTRAGLGPGEMVRHTYTLFQGGRRVWREARYLAHGPGEILAVVRDLTTQKETREELRRSRGLLSTVCRLAKVGGWELELAQGEDALLRPFYWSEELCAICGVGPEFSPTLPEALEFYPAPGRALLRTAFHLAGSEGKSFDLELPLLTAQGDRRWVRVIAKVSHNPEVPRRVYGTVQDITAQKEAEMELRRSEQRYRELYSSISDLIYTQDLEGRFLSFNPSLADILGYDEREIVGCKASEFMKPEFRDAFDRQYLRQIQQTGSHAGVSVYFHKDGSRRYLEYKSRLVLPPVGEPYITGMGRDVTERVLKDKELKRLQKQLLHAQKMEAVGTLAGGIAHDFNNILAALMGYGELALELANRGEDNSANLKRILASVKRARDLVRNILTFSRQVEARLVTMDLGQVVAEAVTILERALPKMIEVQYSPPDAPLYIAGNPGQIEQVVLNLGTNAKDAMPQGGVLAISLRPVSLDEKFCRERLDLTPGDYAVLTVADTGQGIDGQTLNHIFEPFFTTKEPGKGTGLGLSTVFGVVQEHGGRVDCQSRPGQGSTFRVYLPQTTVETQAAPEQETARGVVLSGSETLLLVDDEEAIRDVAGQILTYAGYLVYTAANGEEALEVFEGRSGEIDLVILDLGMPGMGGQACLERLLAQRPGLPVLVASGYLPGSGQNHALETGATGFVAKPFSQQELLSKVREILRPESPAA